jgi:hypothetical protein
MTPSVSVVVEWANTGRAGSARGTHVLGRLRAEVESMAQPVEVLICHDASSKPDLAMAGGPASGWRALAVPGAGYYELKNHGAAASAGEVIVFLDSDAVPEPGWLAAIVEPFSDEKVQVVAGWTHLETGSAYARAFALWWFFPLRDPRVEWRPARHFFANNVAFRQAICRSHPFPRIEGTSKGACLRLADELAAAGVTVWRTTRARAVHPPPLAGRPFVERALAQGRDRVARERGWHRTIVGSAGRLVGHVGRVLVGTWKNRALVGVGPAEIPYALALGAAYYGLCFVGEIGAMLGLAFVKRIEI